MTLVTPFDGELPGVEMPAPRAGVVDALPVSEQRPPIAVRRRKLPECQIMDDGGGEVVGVDRAPRQVHDRHAADDILDPDRAGRVGVRVGDPAERRAGADVDDPGRAAGTRGQDVVGRSPADRAGSADAGGNRALDDQQVPALGHCLVAGLLGGGACRRHQRLVIVERDQAQDKLRCRRVAGAHERLRVAGAVLELQPDDDGPVHLRQGGGDAGGEPGWQGERHGNPRAELQERPPVDPGLSEPRGQRQAFVPA